MRRAAPTSYLAATLLLGLVWIAAATASAQSQGLVVRDGTLGSGPLEVGPGIDPLGQPATYLITPELGEQRGANLFHSFKAFGIGTHETATFTGPDPIAGPQSVSNVISRVTGGNESRIEGTLRSTIPGADVWLLNPSGVVFGQGAQLDVEGSFHASTADSLGFGTDGLERFYSDLSRPSVLSTATPLAFGFLSESGAALLAVERSALEVPDGETLELAGGDVSVTVNAGLVAPGGSVQIEAQDGVLISQSIVDVNRAGATPGTISIRGGKIEVNRSSLVRAENESDVPPSDPDVPGPGTISVAASESVIVDASLLSVSTHAAGNAGTIDIASPEITLRNGVGFDPLTPPQETRAGARAETTSSGRGGEIQLRAEKLVALTNGIGVSASAVGPGVSGNAGAVEIVANEVKVERGSHVSAETAGSGDGGNISIEAGESIEVTDGSVLSARAIGAVDADGLLEAASGSGGELVLRAGSVRIANRGFLSVDSIGSSGDAGVIDITADALTVDALDPRTGTQTFAVISASSSAAPGLFIGQEQPTSVPLTPARAGTIIIKAGSIVFKNGGGIQSTCVRCMGGAGEIWISADEMSVDGSIFAHTGRGSSGAGGYIQIDAGSLVTESRWISTETRDNGTSGNAGDIVIHAGSLTVHGGILAYTWKGSSGNAGTIEVDAGSLRIEGGGINVNTFDGSTGNAGTIEIDTRSLTLKSGGGVDAQAFGAGAGNAGTITVVADTIEIGDESGIRASSREGAGNAGTIDLYAKDWIRLEDAGVEPFSLIAALAGTDFFTGVFSTTAGGGDSGSITLRASEITASKGAFIATSTVGGGDAGDILLLADRIRIEDGAFVDSTSLPLINFQTGQLLLPGGEAGSVTLEASESIEVVGLHPADGAASRVASASLNARDAGEISLTAPRIVLDGGGAVSTGTASLSFGPSGGAGGTITLNAGRDLLVSNGGQVTASTLGSGNAGSIDIHAGESIRVEGAGSIIVSRTGADGQGGNVALEAPHIEVAHGGEISARSEAGLREASATVASLVREGLIADLPGTAEGDAGSIELVADSVRLDGGTIATNAEAADGGNVDILATQLLDLDRGVITATVTDDTGGNVTIDSAVVLLDSGSRIEARAGGGTGGSIQITADNYFAFPGSVVSADSELGIDGIVTVHSPDVDLAGNLTVLPTDYLDASSLMRERCAARSGEPSGSFAVRGNGGIPPEPDGWLRASVLSDTDTTGSAALPAIHVASLPGPFLAQGTCE